MRNLAHAALGLLRGLLSIVAILVAAFLLIRLAPGDAALLLAGEAGNEDPAFIAQLREKMGLDEPLHRQLGSYLWQILRLDLGWSHRNQAAVWELVAERLPATALLLLSAFAISVVLGIGLGVLAARSARNKGRWDRWIQRLSLMLYAAPSFWLALLLVLLFSVRLGWLPAFGMESVGANLTGWARFADRAAHLVLPAFSLSFMFLALYIQLTRSAMLDVYGQDFVRTAQARGLPQRRILLAHVLRNAWLPVITFGGMQLGQMASASLLIEVVFAWPGIGRLLYDSLAFRDVPLLLGIFVVISALVIVLNALTDLLCRVVDPRIRAGGGAA